MATVVLVHGMGAGGWYWARVAPKLRALGHTVFTPTLTGLGERSHLLTREVDLSTHIADIVNLLTWERLRDVTLLGHSYGGMVITGAADALHEAVHRLVYLDAFVPKDGQCLMDLHGEQRTHLFRQQARIKGGGWRLPPTPARFWRLDSKEDVAWMDALFCDHPLATLEQPLMLRNPDWTAPSRVYIRATEFDPSPFAAFGEAAQHNPGWIYREIASNHVPMVSKPDELVHMLQDLLVA